MRSRQAIQGAYLIDINAMVFGMPRALVLARLLPGFRHQRIPEAPGPEQP